MASEHYTNEKIPTAFARPLVFINHHISPPTHTVKERSAKPDFLAVAFSDKELRQYKAQNRGLYAGVPNHLVISSGEWKPKAQLDDERAICDTWQPLEPRPDMPGVHGFFVNSEVYSIIWLDPSGLAISPCIPWENLEPLECYIHSLYHPPSGHHLWDPSITNPTLLTPSDRKSTRLNSSHSGEPRMPSSA